MGRPSALQSFIGLIYPATCIACGNPLAGKEQQICIACMLTLPRTNFHRQSFNPLQSVLRGRVHVDAIASCFFFDKKLRIQRLMHAIKYKGRQEAAEKIGEWYGAELRQSPAFASAEIIVPVPLHPARQKIRGYNQSEAFARGLCRPLEMQLLPTCLERRADSVTQTGKGRMDRWENVRQIFAVGEPAGVHGKSVLLVDDVITTGATLEACAVQLQEAGIRSLGIVTIACAIRI